MLEKKILVLGIGNILLKDEGVGVRAVEELRRSYTLPSEVEAVDGGTAGLGLLDILERATNVIVIDCVLGRAEPGTVYRLPLDELEQPSVMRHSLHELGLLEVLAILQMWDRRPPTVLIGIQPDEIGPGLELSPRVAAQLPAVLEAIGSELARLGVRLQPMGSTGATGPSSS